MNNLELKEIINRNNNTILQYITLFEKTKKPIPVSFRKILPELKNIDRYTHLIHSYPAKLLVHIPYFFLNNSMLSKEGDTVLDPFCGAGTVLLEGILSKRNALGADSNPLARLITEVKVTKLKTSDLSSILKDIIKKAKGYKKGEKSNVVNRDYWFSPNVSESLSKILKAITKIECEKIKKFMLVSFSNCVKKVSYADPRVSVPVKLNLHRYEKGSIKWDKIKNRLFYLREVNVYDKFEYIVNENIKRFKEFENIKEKEFDAKVISTDARNLTSSLEKNNILLSNDSIQLIISSPPYAGAQKYIRATSLNLGWTNLADIKELTVLDKNTIGRESYKKSEIAITKTGIKKADELIRKIYKIKPERAFIICTYIIEMEKAFDEMIRVLKKKGFLVLIVGNNKICNIEFNAQYYFSNYLINKGLELKFKLIDDIKSYGLMTKRNKTADIISREWILVFQKK